MPAGSKEKTRSNIIKDAGIYTGATYASRLVDAVNGVLLRNFINPASMGVWAFLNVILGYFRYTTLGIGPALVREIPVCRGRGDEEKASEIKDTVFCFSLLTSAIFSVGIIAWAVFSRHSLSREMMWGLVAISIVLVLQRYLNIYIVLLRAYKYFKVASLSTVISSFVTLLLTVALVWKYKFYGLLFSVVINYIVNIAFVQYRVDFKFRFRVNRTILKDLSTFGLSLISVSAAVNFLSSIDRIVIAKLIGFEALGYYSVAIMFQTYLMIAPNVMDMILNPHIFEKVTDSSEAPTIRSYVLEPAMAMAGFMACVIMLTWMSAPLLVHFLMPKYESGVPALKILIFSSFFWGMTRPFMGYLILCKKHLEVWPILLVASLLAVLLDLFFVMGAGGGIERVALATVIAFAVYGSGMFLLAIRHMKKISNWGLFVLKIMGPLCYVLAVIFVFGDFLKLEGKSVGQCFLAVGGYSAFALPLMILVEKETRLFSHLRLIAAEKFLRKKKS